MLSNLTIRQAWKNISNIWLKLIRKFYYTRHSQITILRVVFACLLSMTFVAMSKATVVMAVTNSYFGSGYFSTSTLVRCHVGGHATQAQNASAAWSSGTDINMTYSCTGTHIITNNGTFGSTGWAGYGNVCSSGGCALSGGNPWNNMYNSCEALLNQTSFDNNPGYYTNAVIETLATHELGHCYSLDHATNTSVMNASSTIQTQDVNLINARY